MPGKINTNPSIQKKRQECLLFSENAIDSVEQQLNEFTSAKGTIPDELSELYDAFILARCSLILLCKKNEKDLSLYDLDNASEKCEDAVIYFELCIKKLKREANEPKTVVVAHLKESEQQSRPGIDLSLLVKFTTSDYLLFKDSKNSSSTVLSQKKESSALSA